MNNDDYIKKAFTLLDYQEKEKATKRKMADAILREKYKITLETYEDMLQKQGGVCAICKKPNQSKRRMSVDHCHNTGMIRGILCSSCNMGIGCFKNNLDLLDKATKYLFESELTKNILNQPKLS